MIELEEIEFCSAARKEEESVMCNSDSVSLTEDIPSVF